jgi:hypothetical protein
MNPFSRWFWHRSPTGAHVPQQGGVAAAAQIQEVAGKSGGAQRVVHLVIMITRGHTVH